MADYLVIKGKDRATIEIAQETKVVFPFTFNVVAVKATSGSVTVSLSAGAQSGDDGSDTIAEGDSTVFSQLTAKEIYISGSGTVKVWAGVRPEFCPFKSGAKGGGSGDGCNYKGTTTTPISNGSTTNPITIDGEEYTAVFGDIVVYGYTEFVFDGTQWSEFGRPFDTTPTSGSANAVTSDGVYKNTAGKKYYYSNTLKGEIFNDYTNNTATGNYSHAEGYYAKATGDMSHAEGRSTTASGESSHAEGYFATASGNVSHAEGEYTIASQRNMTAIGKYNSPRTGDLFNIGNGNGSARSNIVEVNSTELNVNGEIKKNGVSLPTPYTTMPTITAAMLGQIAQYVGETTNDYVKGYFYIASSDGAAEPTYSWVSMVDSTPTSGSKNFVTSDGIKTALDTKQNIMQYAAMPTITEAMLGKVVQYVGVSDSNYNQGWNYVAVSDGAQEPTYSWQALMDNGPTNGSNNPVKSNGVYWRTPFVRSGINGTSAYGGESSTASGRACFAYGYYITAGGGNVGYATAFGYNTQAKYDYLFACGKVNSPKSGDLFEIGNGSGSSRSNILEANSTSVNINGDIQRDGVGIDDYTTTERKIGKWIDGSDLYQRTFEVTASSVDGWNDNVLGTSGIKIVDVQGFMYGWYEDAYLSKPLVYYRSTTDYITVLYDDDVNVYIIDPGVSTSPMPTLTITIKYTKISAQALSQSYQIPSDNPFNISVTEASETPTVEEDMR